MARSGFIRREPLPLTVWREEPATPVQSRLGCGGIGSADGRTASDRNRRFCHKNRGIPASKSAMRPTGIHHHPRDCDGVSGMVSGVIGTDGVTLGAESLVGTRLRGLGDAAGGDVCGDGWGDGAIVRCGDRRDGRGATLGEAAGVGMASGVTAGGASGVGSGFGVVCSDWGTINSCGRVGEILSEGVAGANGGSGSGSGSGSGAIVGSSGGGDGFSRTGSGDADSVSGTGLGCRVGSSAGSSGGGGFFCNAGAAGDDSLSSGIGSDSDGGTTLPEGVAGAIAGLGLSSSSPSLAVGSSGAT